MTGLSPREPPYSPELNPIEKVWQHIKQELSWEIYENLDEIKEKVSAFIKKFSLLTIASITGWDYIRSALATVAGFWRSGITYARGMENFTVGDVESATEQFSKLPRRVRLVNIDGVSLSIPDEVPLTTVELDFLLRLLQVISDSDGEPHIVYPILQANLDKLDDSFSALLRSYVANIVSLEEPEQVQAIVAIIVTLSNLLTDFILANRANNLEIAIAGYEIALRILLSIVSQNKGQ